jgi:exopolysaccharide biosynthesis polyprenyl glycosylphosphotransferase
MALTAETFRSTGDTQTAAAADPPLALLPARSASRVRWPASALVLSLDAVALGAALALCGAWSPVGLAYLLGVLATLTAARGYRPPITLSALESAPWLLGRLAIPLVVLGPIALRTGDEAAIFTAALLAVPLVLVGRVLSYAAIRRTRRRGHLLDRAVIVGAGEIGAELARTFADYPEYGIDPVGFLDCVGGRLPLPLLGDIDGLSTMLERRDIRRVIVAFGPQREAELVSVLRTAVQHDVEVHVVPRFFDFGVTPDGPDTDDVRGIPLYRLRGALRGRAWWLKRTLDVTVAGALLLATAPLMLMVAVAVKLSSPGPVLFRQRRVGEAGREIEVPKFRTMRVNGDSDTQWSPVGDDRITPVGRLLRRTSLDELPQLWTVLRGDMSLVGPRPERPHFVERFSVDVDGYRDRHRVPAGLTGWAQVHGLRGDTSISERVRFDNHYIEHWSIWRDVVVLARSAAEVLRGTRVRER